VSGLGWDDAALAQIAGSRPLPGILFRMSTDPIIRLWAGVGDFTIPTDLVETESGVIYSGAGELLDLPTVSQLINGIAERVAFSISGVSVTAPLASMASGLAADVRDRSVNLGICALDNNFQRLSPVAWLWEGQSDSLIVDRGAGQDGVIRRLTLSVGSIMTGRRRPSIAYFTDPDQKLRSPDDRFFDRVKLYEAGSTKVWPE
jgi:hypothetical protein